MALPEFREVDWTAPFNIDDYITVIPNRGTIKGMFYKDLFTQAEKCGKTLRDVKQFSGFKDYPLRDYMKLCLEASGVIYPRVSVREALRRLVGDPVSPQSD